VQVARKCTESDLETVKLSAKSMIGGLSEEQKVEVFHAAFDGLKESHPDLAAGLEAEFRGAALNESLLVTFWTSVIGMYPDTELLKAYIEPGIQSTPKMAELWYENQPLIARFFVK